MNALALRPVENQTCHRKFWWNGALALPIPREICPLNLLVIAPRPARRNQAGKSIFNEDFLTEPFAKSKRARRLKKGGCCRFLLHFSKRK